MEVDIQFLPTPLDSKTLSKKNVVVIDVLRATSVIIHALSEGAVEVIPVATVDEAFEKVKRFPQGTTLLGGERHSQKIEGFDLGNSPREYVAEKVRGKRIILTTTNGTKAFNFVSLGKVILICSFFNLKATARRCLSFEKDLLIFPSGDEGNFSLEDVVCGGMLIEEMKKVRPSIRFTDATQAARIIYERFKENLLEAFSISRHGRDLIQKGFKEDLSYCAQTDLFEIVPIFRDGGIKVTHL